MSLEMTKNLKNTSLSMFQCGTSFVDLLCFRSVLCLLCLCARLFICLCGHLLGRADLLALVCGV